MVSATRLSRFREVDCAVHSAGVTSVDIDRDEGRYLLVGGGDGTVYIHDLLNLTGTPAGSTNILLQVGKSHSQVHKYSVETVSWYRDTGIFITSARDGTLKVMD